MSAVLRAFWEVMMGEEGFTIVIMWAVRGADSEDWIECCLKACFLGSVQRCLDPDEKKFLG